MSRVYYSRDLGVDQLCFKCEFWGVKSCTQALVKSMAQRSPSDESQVLKIEGIGAMVAAELKM